MQFSADYGVLTVDEMIDYGLSYRSFRVFREVEAVCRKFVPAFCCVGFDEVKAVFQKSDNVSLKFSVVKGICFF